VSYPQRVAGKASEIQWARLILSVLSAPFYAVGFLLGLLFALVSFIGAAIALGVADARNRGADVTDAR
jgi:hypothetical protein